MRLVSNNKHIHEKSPGMSSNFEVSIFEAEAKAMAFEAKARDQKQAQVRIFSMQ